MYKTFGRVTVSFLDRNPMMVRWLAVALSSLIDGDEMVLSRTNGKNHGTIFPSNELDALGPFC